MNFPQHTQSEVQFNAHRSRRLAAIWGMTNPGNILIFSLVDLLKYQPLTYDQL